MVWYAELASYVYEAKEIVMIFLTGFFFLIEICTLQM